MHTHPRKVVVVTGAVGNLGRAVARAFQRDGAHLVLLDRGAGRLEREFSDLAGGHDHLLVDGIELGGAQEESLRRVVQSARSRFGRLDVLVNTIGAWRGGSSVLEAPLADWEFLYAANLQATLVACRAVVPHLVELGGGSVVNVAARSGLVGTAGSAAYCAAKSSVLRLTEALSDEVRGTGVRVNAVLPSTIDTPQNRGAMGGAAAAGWVEPDAIADVILFLASPAARAVHGAAIPVYGAI
ncbi:MAG: SDR family oxidoreductase [Opitutaceae bacterium]|nr:SDR family oxidoreductase [Opitutaceae bacterium]